MDKKALVYFILIATWALLQPISAHTEGIGLVTAVRGTATVTRQPVPQPKAVSFRDDLFWQDVLNTGADSRLRMLILKKSVITMKEQSRLQLREEAPTPTQPRRKSILSLLAGSLRVVVEKEALRERDYEIRTNIAIAAIRGSDLIGERVSANEANFYTGPTGTARVTTSGVAPADLAPLQRARVTPGLIEIVPIIRSFYDTLRTAIAPGGAAARRHRAAKSEQAETKSASRGGIDAFKASAARSLSVAIDRSEDAIAKPEDPNFGSTGSGTKVKDSSPDRFELISGPIRKEAKTSTAE